MNSSSIVHTAIIINNGVMSFNAIYIPINKIHIVERIEYLRRRLTSVNIPAINIVIASDVLVRSLDFAIATHNHISIGAKVKSHDNP